MPADGLRLAARPLRRPVSLLAPTSESAAGDRGSRCVHAAAGTAQSASTLKDLPPPFAVRVRRGCARVLVEVTGELDIATSGLLRRRLDELRRAGWPAVAMDLRDVSLMDASSLRVLVAARREFRSAGARLWVIAESTAVERLFDVCSGMADDLRRQRSA